MLKLVSVLGLLCVSLFTFAEKVSLAQFNIEYPPLQQNINGKLDGPDLQLSIEAFRRMPSFELEVVQMSIARSMRDYRLGKLDLFFNYSNKEFQDYSLYPDYPLRWAEYRLLVLAGKGFKYESPQDLRGKRIGLINVVPLGEELQAAKDKNYIEVSRIASHRQVLEMLKRGRVDAIFMYTDVALHYADEVGLEVEVMHPGPYSRRGFYPSISLRAPIKNHVLLQKELSEALGSMYRDGTHKAILQRYGVGSVVEVDGKGD
ncbi:MAG: ABC transporter substrate-binding protein [Cellvibrionaceae bacterium]|nr:ABC transporter substrate-binding protein [Cellvibrionaceae bacterium]